MLQRSLARVALFLGIAGAMIGIEQAIRALSPDGEQRMSFTAAVTSFIISLACWLAVWGIGEARISKMAGGYNATKSRVSRLVTLLYAFVTALAGWAVILFGVLGRSAEEVQDRVGALIVPSVVFIAQSVIKRSGKPIEQDQHQDADRALT